MTKLTKTDKISKVKEKTNKTLCGFMPQPRKTLAGMSFVREEKPSVNDRLRPAIIAKREFRRADVAKLADALDLGSSGKPWGFKSLHPHHNFYNQ